MPQREFDVIERQFDIGQSQHRSQSFVPHVARRGPS
jgi:hypothetical protein